MSLSVRAAAVSALLLVGCAAAPPQATRVSTPSVSPENAVVVPARDRAALEAAARAHPLAFLDRIGWGADAEQLRDLRREGAMALLDEQLRSDPHPILPAPVATMLASMQVNEPLTELMPPLVRQRRALGRRKRAGDGDVADAKRVGAQIVALNRQMNELTRQAMTEQLMLAVYAPNQLQQRLTWFWLNHFNVFRGGFVGPMMADYVQRVIAPRSLGHFRDLLEATMFSPQMLLYLNNAQNARGHINENYARELMELHTLGVGSGYTQSDVTNLAHVLTGLGVNLTERPLRVRPALRGDLWQRGLVVFNPARHDESAERVLGRTFSGRGPREIERVATLLAAEPATARHVSLELARYFVADRPDPAMLDAMVAAWRASDGDIATVLRAMFTSPAFAAGLSAPQFKDPMRYVVSAARASLGGRTITHPQPLIGMLYRLGEPLYGRQTPDGYPLSGGAWSSPGQLTASFEVAQQFAYGAPALFAAAVGDAPHTRAAVRSQPAPDLASSPIFLAEEPVLGRATLQTLARADARVRWNALWLSSPEFMTQ